MLRGLVLIAAACAALLAGAGHWSAWFDTDSPVLALHEDAAVATAATRAPDPTPAPTAAPVTVQPRPGATRPQAAVPAGGPLTSPFVVVPAALLALTLLARRIRRSTRSAVTAIR
jgi:hypothetical protein